MDIMASFVFPPPRSLMVTEWGYIGIIFDPWVEAINQGFDSYGVETDVDDVNLDASMFGHDMNWHGCKWRMVAPIIAAQPGDALISNNLARLYITTVILFVIK